MLLLQVKGAHLQITPAPFPDGNRFLGVVFREDLGDKRIKDSNEVIWIRQKLAIHALGCLEKMGHINIHHRAARFGKMLQQIHPKSVSVRGAPACSCFLPNDVPSIPGPESEPTMQEYDIKLFRQQSQT